MNFRDPQSVSGAGAPVARARRRVLLTTIAVAIFALLVRIPGIEQGPNVDELLNVLAARAWVERGELAIVDGADPYERGAALTRIQARFIAWGDDDLVAARMVSLGFGLAVVVGAVVWGGAVGGVLAGGVAGTLVAIDPLLVQLHQSARFYAAVQLFFLLGAGLFAAAIAARTTLRKVLLGGGAAASFAVAIDLQIVSMIGAAFVAAFAALWHLPTIASWYRPKPLGWRLAIGGGILVAAGLGAVFVVGTGFLDRMIQLATYTDYWGESTADNFRFYYVFLHDQFASIMVLLPLLAVLAAARNRLHGSFTFFVFLGAVVTASFLAWKAPRYISHLLPVLYVGVGLGVAGSWDLLKAHVPGLTQQAFGVKARWVPMAFILAVLGALILGNRALLVTGRLITRDPALHHPLMAETTPTVSWARALPTLQPWADSADLIASNRPSKALYYLGRLDYSLQYNALDRLAPGEADLGTAHDARYNVPVTTDPDLLREATCQGSLLVVNNRVAQQGASAEAPEFVTFLETRGQLIELPRPYGLNAYWFPLGSDCDSGPDESPGF